MFSIHFKYMSSKLFIHGSVCLCVLADNYVTGLCPQGFLSGAYGIGSCYLMFQLPVSLSYAIQSCRGYGAYLLTIETALEQQFVKDFIGNNSAAGKTSNFSYINFCVFLSSAKSLCCQSHSTVISLLF